MKNENKLTDNTIWKQATSIAEHMYGKLDEFGHVPDEKWNSERKLRNAANDVMFFVAQAVGSSMPDAAEYDWNNARKNLFALRTVYTFAHKQKFITLEPEIVVKIDALLAGIDGEIANTKREIEKKSKKDMEPWLEKYRLWKEMQA
jgi:hypothetical protein